ncbi:hypothetical protein [Rhizobium sp. Leaf386]|uniref:hypothetical protein n=1 Tax=Rhizobium sp. Leaf386 TaxID=1736359 RepID=UPI0012E219CE|nr:hypothetical protein [Rhizobium sp. Leaf386]
MPQKADTGGTVVPLTPKAEPPKEMTRADRRIVNEKIADVYDDGAERYSLGWTDKRVADDLGVPIAWVREERDRYFGPEGSNPLLDEFLMAQADVAASVALFQADRAALGALVDATISQVKAGCAKVTEFADGIRRRGDDLDARLRDLQALARRVEKEIGR